MKSYFIPGYGAFNESGIGRNYFLPGFGVVSEYESVAPDECVSHTFSESPGDFYYSPDSLYSLTFCEEAIEGVDPLDLAEFFLVMT
jgi:hypothetical protein